MKWCFVLACMLFGALAGPARAERATIAVATNFVKPAAALAQAFYQKTGDEIVLSGGSTGKLYAQILNGAPYDAFLSADRARPALLFEAGLSGPPVTYAQGALVWWPELPSGGDGKIALANPELAPYGAAALQILQAREDWEVLKDRLVYGENVGQAFALAATGNAEAGIVALSVVLSDLEEGEPVPDILSGHAPILQDGVLLKPDAPNPVAAAFLQFLVSADAQDMLSERGYQPVLND